MTEGRDSGTTVWQGFRVEKPADAFEAFCQEELPRIRDTDPDYDPEVYGDAVALALTRLRLLSDTRPPPNEEEAPEVPAVGDEGPGAAAPANPGQEGPES